MKGPRVLKTSLDVNADLLHGSINSSFEDSVNVRSSLAESRPISKLETQ